jgi:hypothetical protein
VTFLNSRTVVSSYLIEGFKEAAEKFQQESGISPSMDLDSLDDRIRIRDAIQSGRIQEATALVNQLHPELLDNDRYLYFHLQVMCLTPAKLHCSFIVLDIIVLY